MSISLLGAQVLADPKLARERILKAIEEAEGDRREAARTLGTTHRSFYRIVERLNLWPEIDKLMNAKGFAKMAGPPRTSEKIRDALITAKGDVVRAARALGMKADALRERILELRMLDDLNKVLKAAGYSPIEIDLDS